MSALYRKDVDVSDPFVHGRLVDCPCEDCSEADGFDYLDDGLFQRWWEVYPGPTDRERIQQWWLDFCIRKAGEGWMTLDQFIAMRERERS